MPYTPAGSGPESGGNDHVIVMSLKERFEQIYSDNLWGGSGEGSHPRHNRGYSQLLMRLCRDHQVRSVVDLGCGDWQFSRFIDWGGIRYQGYDVVRSVVEANQARFASPTVSFHAYDGDVSRLPDADLLIVKDVLQHLSNEEVKKLLPHLRRYRLALITNCVPPDGSAAGNTDIAVGDTRWIDLRLPPFNVPAEAVYEFTNRLPFWLRPFRKPRWRKLVLLTRG